MKYVYYFFFTFFAAHLFAQDISKKLDHEINRRVNLEINPSVSIGILLADGSKKFYGYGEFNQSKKQPDHTTLYEIGSVTKTFTAWLANRKLKDTINIPLSSFFGDVKNSTLDSITAYDLQNHIAGLPRLSNQFSPNNWSDPFNGYSNEILQKELQNLNPEQTQNWAYSNLGYTILGRTIELVSKESYQSLMGNLLEDARMQNTFFSVPKNHRNMAKPTNLGTLNSYWNFTGPSRYAGGLVSNTEDLLNYLKYQKENNPLFSAEALHKTIQTGVPNLGKDKLFYQEGWFVLKPDSSTQILLHNGGTGGFISFIGYNKNTDVGVVVLSNSVNIVDDIGINILYPDFKLNQPERTIAYEIADLIDQGNGNDLFVKYDNLKDEGRPHNIIDIYWLERFHFGKANYLISNQLSDIMVKELPEDWEVHDIKGQNLEKLKRYTKAIQSYEIALKLNPENQLIKESLKRCTAILKSHAD